MAYSGLLNLAAIFMTIHLSVHAQPAVAGRNRLWLWVFLLLIASAVVAWFLGREGQQHTPLPASPADPQPNPQPQAPPPVEVTRSTVVDGLPPTEATTELAEPEDLTRIEGIGPKINALLHGNGFRTYADVARADATVLKQVLVDAGLRIHDPSTWPEQAALAAAGRWDALAELQARLKAGRRAASQS